MKQIFTFLSALLFPLTMQAQGWPEKYEGVMLQGFYWDSFADTQWTNLESQADEFSEFFKLVWVPQSGYCGPGNSMGYNDLYWFDNYNSSFGNEAQLRSMIKTFKSKGIGTIADVVINHRASLAGTWMSFPKETYKGNTYTFGAADICKNDDGGKTLSQAEVKPTGANDTGEDFDGYRDIDHTSANVQTVVKAYLDFLLNDLGYAGFRYDMVKGYAAQYTGLYNAAANPQYSVGEYWDGNSSTLQNWIDGTTTNGAKQSAAFDFALKYNLRDCCNAGTNWGVNLTKGALALTPAYSRYAVTFVDNHDTYGRGNDSETTKNQLAANAFILGAPGTPCIFLSHWKMYKQAIKQMIYARNLARINNQSTMERLVSNSQQYAMKVTGTSGSSVVVLMGNNDNIPSGTNAADYFLAQKGENFAYYISKNTETAWADVPSGSYDGGVTVTLSAVSTDGNAKIVYTTDGSEPTAKSTSVASGSKITLSKSATLKAALLSGGAVKGMITRHYTVTNFSPYTITVNVKDPGWTSMYFHTWGDYRTGTTWPGDLVTTTKTEGGVKWYYKTYDITRSDDYVNFVFDAGGSNAQTVDVLNVKKNTYFELSAEKGSDGKYTVTDVTDKYGLGIAAPQSNRKGVTAVYSATGVRVRSFTKAVGAEEALKGLAPGLYIAGGSKYVVK